MVRPDQIHGGTHRARLGDVVRLAALMRRDEHNAYPAAVTCDESGRLVLLAGGRRLAAQQRNDMEAPVAVIECSTWSDFAQWMIADTLASEEYDQKPTSLLEAVALVEKILHLLKPHYRDPVVPTVCAYLGVDNKQVGYARSAMRKYLKDGVSAEVRAYTEAKLAAADAGEIAAHTAYEHSKAFADAVATPTMAAGDQRRRLQVGGSTLAGVMAGFADLGTINPGLTDSELSAYIETLSAARLQLERTIRSLRAAQGERAQ